MTHLDRRQWFSWVGGGLGGAALASLLLREGIARGATHHPAKARRVIHVCLCGGMSHLDSFDYKPALAKYHGKPIPSSERPDTFFGQIGLMRRNDWEFRRRGRSGLWVS